MAINSEKQSFDTLVVITAPDFDRLKSNYPRLINNLPSEKIIFIGSEEVGTKCEELKNIVSNPDKISFINENDILKFDLVHNTVVKHLSPFLNGQTVPRRVTGWYYQQFLKMNYSLYCNNDYYMTWDGDTIPCKSFSMFQEGSNAPYMDIKTEFHPQYFDTMAKLIPGMHKCISKSFISEHMLFNTSYMKKMIESIENNKEIDGDKFYEKIIYAIEPNKFQDGCFSEFETYGTYLCLNDPFLYKLREWHSFRLGGEFFDPETIDDADYEWLSKDFFAISFEKGHSVRDDHKNLFDNKDYQSKLSARKMLEVAQEAFTDGYIEVWGEGNNPT